MVSFFVHRGLRATRHCGLTLSVVVLDPSRHCGLDPLRHCGLDPQSQIGME